VLLKYFAKNIVLSRRVWIFGMFFGLFLLYIGYSQANSGIGATVLDQTYYSIAWMGIIILFMFGTISTTIAQSAIYSSASLPYLFKFTRFSRKSYLYNIVFSSLLVGASLATVILIIATLVFSFKFDFIIYSRNYAYSYLIIIVGEMFMIFMALFIVLITINYLGAKTVNYIQSVPMLLSYGFGILILTSGINNVYIFYLVPFSAFVVAFQSSFLGLESLPVAGGIYTVFTPYMIISLSLWTLAMAVIDVMLLRNVKVSSLDERAQL
jgi:hypothetical protein